MFVKGISYNYKYNSNLKSGETGVGQLVMWYGVTIWLGVFFLS